MNESGFSVILTTRDRPALLADALRSVNDQSLAPLEVVIANDSAQPLELAVSSLGTMPVHVLQVDVRNPGAARNRAVAATQAPWIAFLDDDDLWLPEHLAGLATAMSRPEIEVAHRDCAVIREEIGADGRRIEGDRRVIARNWDEAIMRENDFIPPSATAVRRAPSRSPWQRKLQLDRSARVTARSARMRVSSGGIRSGSGPSSASPGEGSRLS